MVFRHVFGPAVDEPLVSYIGAGTDRRFLAADERGSILLATKNDGSVWQANAYDEFGKPGASNSGRFQYTGQVWLGEIGAYYYKARVYAPHLGRFLQTDPIGYEDGANLYAYVGNDPINFTDPLGLQDEEIIVIGRRKTADGGGTNRGQVGWGFPNVGGIGNAGFGGAGGDPPDCTGLEVSSEHCTVTVTAPKPPPRPFPPPPPLLARPNPPFRIPAPLAIAKTGAAMRTSMRRRVLGGKHARRMISVTARQAS